MTRRRWIVLGCLLAGVAGLIPSLYTTHLRNFRAVRPGVLYRSGQLSPTGLDLVLRAYQIRTVVTLRTVRDPGHPYPDAWEAAACAARGARHVRILPRSWLSDETGVPPAAVAVREFLAVMDDPANHPVLVHCFAGVHRTGTLAAVFRVEFEGWDADAAIAELEKGGFAPGAARRPIDAFVRGYRRQAGRQ
ncbi:tyrosine-protein phosphatase [bacterium]|nr:tyrosine-protein phosphatase [bacterium]